jgi:hypothetical protein
MFRPKFTEEEKRLELAGTLLGRDRAMTDTFTAYSFSNVMGGQIDKSNHHESKSESHMSCETSLLSQTSQKLAQHNRNARARNNVCNKE